MVTGNKNEFKNNKFYVKDTMSEIWKPLTIDDHETGYTISSHGSVQDENKKLFKFYEERSSTV